MRLCVAVLTSILTAAAVTIGPVMANAAAAPTGLTINATPNSIGTGQGVLVYGQLAVPPVSAKRIVLYQHIAGSGRRYAPVATTTTNMQGSYEFDLSSVDTNRSWFVREAGVRGVYSHAVSEQVSALVSINATPTAVAPLHRVTFTGKVEPGHRFEPIVLQDKTEGSGWKTIVRGKLGAGSTYALSFSSWLTPGVRDVRVVFPGDVRNAEGSSNPAQVRVEQPQVKEFTINSSDLVIPDGQSAAITGTLYKRGTTREPRTSVQLWGKPEGASRYHLLAQSVTNSAGAYTFKVTPAHNVFYQVRTAFRPFRRSAVLWEGVHDVATMTPVATTASVGSPATFTGTVTPDKAGRRIYLQLLVDGDWRSVESDVVQANSTFEFGYRLGTPGSYEFRARIYGEGHNVGTASAPIVITATGAAKVVAVPQGT